MSKLGTLILSGLCLLATSVPALAADEAPRRFSAEALVGLNFVWPTYELLVGYRLPVWEDRLEAFAGYSPWSMSLSTATYDLTEVGLRGYVVPTGPLQTYGTLSFGSSTSSYRGLRSPVALVGVGVDWMPSSQLGLTGSITFGLPTLVRPMVGVRLAI